jgi:parallel beta-helix repeat protein
MNDSTPKRILVAAAALAALASARSDAAVITVPHGPGTPLQDAIDAASPGDLLRLEGGIFNEAVTVDKPLKLTSTTANPAIINGGCGAPASVEIASDGVTIDNVAVNGAAEYAVDVVGRADVKLRWILMQSQCRAPSTGSTSSRAAASRSAAATASGSPTRDSTSAGIAAGAGVLVSKGSAQGNVRGVLLEDSSPGLRVRGVRALNNSLAGIFVRNTDGALVAGNEVTGNPTGIALDGTSDENRIKGNRLSDNGIDGDDQGTGNCWRGNRNPTGAALTGTIPTTGCP